MFFILISIVQIITESLPISSSSHVRLIGMLDPLTLDIPEGVYYFLHVPTVIVICWFYRGIIMRSLSTWYDVRFMHHRSYMIKSWIRLALYSCLGLIFPVLFMYGFIKPVLKSTVWYHGNVIWLAGLLVTALSLYSLRLVRSRQRFCSWPVVIIVNIIQALALFPGISRFASTYVAARWLGLSARHAFNLIFLLQMPLLMGALLFKGIPSFFEYQQVYDLTSLVFWMMMVIAGFIAYAAMSFAWWLAITNRFWIFAGYMALFMLVVMSVVASTFF